jgi:Short C-terminal domain
MLGPGRCELMDQPRRHRRTVIAILIVATLLGFLSVFAIWVKRQALETDTWTDTSTKLLENQEVQTAVAGFLVDELYTNTDVQAELAKALPPRTQPLAGPVAGALRELANRIALEALSRPRVQLLWANANRQAHALFLKLINDGEDALSTTGGAVTLNLGTIVDQLGSQLGVDVSGKLPPDAAQIQLVKSDQLSTAQDVVKALKSLSLILPLIALALYALAVYLAQGWRREAVRAWGVSWIAIGMLVLVVRSLAGTAVVDSLASTESVKPAVNATWDIGTSLLRDGGIAMLGYGIVIFLAAVLAGPLSIAQRTRRSLAPLLRDRPGAYAAVAVIVLLLLWWSPTEGFRRLLPSLVLFGLLIAGVEALRRQTNGEYPDETWADVRDRWAGGFSNLRRGSGQETATAGPASGRLNDLERLTGLRDSGVLSPEEFEAEKKRILAG